jgi:hypothetical protein
MRTQTSKAKSQQLNTHQKNLETEPTLVHLDVGTGLCLCSRIVLPYALHEYCLSQRHYLNPNEIHKFTKREH